MAKSWTPDFDMSTIPDEVFRSERSRRISNLRQTYSGGVVWSVHRPGYSRCRCEACIKDRKKRRKEQAKVPKRPVGRPPKKGDQ